MHCAISSLLSALHIVRKGKYQRKGVCAVFVYIIVCAVFVCVIVCCVCMCYCVLCLYVLLCFCVHMCITFRYNQIYVESLHMQTAPFTSSLHHVFSLSMYGMVHF